MKDLQGTKTLANLMAAFAGESQARNKYTYYASKAKKDGFEQISQIFTESANNEKEHAKIWFKLINGAIAATADNLADAASGENFEWTEMYPEFAKEAKEEGFDNIAALFEKVAQIEKEHEQRFTRLLENIKNEEVFKKAEPQTWICSNCGFKHEGPNAPSACPVCAHPQAYFEILAENY